MCSSCWRCCCCSKIGHEDPPARRVRPRQSNNNLQATTRSHNISRRSNTGGINSGEEKLPVSSLPPVRPVQAAQAVSIPPIVNWMTAGRSRTRQNSTSGTTSSGRISAPRGILESRGLENRRRSSSLEDVASISSSAEDTSSVGETPSLSGRSPEREIVSRAGQTPPPPPSVILGGDSPGEQLPLEIFVSQGPLPESTPGPTVQLPLEASRSREAISGVSNLGFSGREQYANDLPNQPNQELQEIVLSDLGDSLLSSTASGQLLVQGEAPANDVGSTDLPLSGGEDAIQSRNMHNNGEKGIPRKKQVGQGKFFSLSRTPPKEVSSTRSSITDYRTKQKRRGAFPLSRAPMSSLDQKGLSKDHASHAGPSSWEASDEERGDLSRHGSRKGRKKHALQQPRDRGPKGLYQGEAEVSQMVASTAFTAESTILPKPKFSANGKDRSSYQPIPRGMAGGNVSGEKRAVFNSRKTSSQGSPAAQRGAPGTTAPEKDPTIHRSTTKPLKMQGGLYSGNGQPGKLTQLESVATADDSRQQALAISRHPISEAGSSNPGRAPSIVPGSDFKPGVNANDEDIPVELSAHADLSVLSSTSELHTQKSVHGAIVAPRPKARVVRSRAAQLPTSTVRRRTISLPRSNQPQTAGSVRQREYYLLDENPDNWLSPSMELYEIADVVYGYLTEYISFMGLGDFYPRGSSYLHELSANAASMIKRVTRREIEGIADNFIDNFGGVAESLRGDGAGDAGDAEGVAAGDSTVLSTPNDIIDMIKVALYDVIIYCDDSGSMNAEGGGRIEALKELVRRVTKITSVFDPAGIKVRFINFAGDDGFNNLHTVDEAQQVLNTVNFSGGTRIGTGLEQKILNPLLFDKLRTGTLKRPLLVTTITDGSPYGEDESHFKNMIVKCKETLREEGFQSTSVMFQVSQVGSATDGEHFIHILHNDSQVGEMVHCTAEKVDDKISELKDSAVDLERWLLDLLLQGL